jgi:7,8-dihydropterin-6-yl-methyl-4-(beta-D-ribofuranosyl)aminobenzene 5'-phosphate synthase
MWIQALIENRAPEGQSLKTQHGLSLYIETKKHKLLFDAGADDLFLHNAAALGIDLTQVDTMILSHGHYDHGGGLNAFLAINQKAKIYIHRKAFLPHLFKKPDGTYLDIGVDPSLQSHPRVVLIDHDTVIDEECRLFCDITQQDFVAKSNLALLKQEKTTIEPDDFLHEQSLWLESAGKKVLITGCSHRGIVNIVEYVSEKQQQVPDIVIGGFHLYNPGNQVSEPKDFVLKVGERLKKIPTHYYTCHCTGEESFATLLSQLQDQLTYLYTGTIIEWKKEGKE